MFWVDSANHKIESAWMDGSNIRTVVTVNVSDPTSITVDHYMKARLFWADMKKNVIESSNVDGTDRVLVAHKGKGPVNNYTKIRREKNNENQRLTI